MIIQRGGRMLLLIGLGASCATVIGVSGAWAQSGWKKNSAGHDVYDYKPQPIEPEKKPAEKERPLGSSSSRTTPVAPTREPEEKPECPEPGSHRIGSVGGIVVCSDPKRAKIAAAKDAAALAALTEAAAAAEPPLSMDPVTDPSVLAIAKGRVRWSLPKLDRVPTYQKAWGPDARSLYVVGSDGVYQSDDAGQTWRASNPKARMLWGVWGSSPKDVYVVGSTIEHSADGGLTWQQQAKKLTASFTKARAMRLLDVWGNGKNVYAVGHEGVALRTSDGGEHWTRLKLGTSDMLTGVSGQGNTVYIVGDKGLIMKSANSGETWTNETSGTTVQLLHVWAAPEGSDVFIAGGGGTMLHSKGDGVWSPIALPLKGRVTSVWGTSAKDLYSLVDYNHLLHTHDGGSTWVREDFSVTTGMYGLWGPSENDVYVIGHRAIVHGVEP